MLCSTFYCLKNFSCSAVGSYFLLCFQCLCTGHIHLLTLWNDRFVSPLCSLTLLPSLQGCPLSIAFLYSQMLWRPPLWSFPQFLPVWGQNTRFLNGLRGLPRWLSDKESVCQAGNTGLVPESGRSPGEESGNPLQYSCLGNAMDGGAWRATVHAVRKEFHTT